MTDESFWDHLPTLAPSSSSPAHWRTTEVLPPVTFIERIRRALPEDEESPEATATLNKWHLEHRGSGFGGVWRGPDDAALSPSWLALSSISVDVATGNVAAAGHLAYDALGIQYDAPSFLVIDGLYVGSLRSGSFLPLEVDVSVESVDLDPRTGEIAVLHHLGSSTFAVSIVATSGVRRLITVLDGLSGTEPVRFSPDGRWLLVPQTRATYLVEVATGRHLLLGVGNTGWAPSQESCLLTIVHEDGTAVPQLFSLQSNSVVRGFPAIELDIPLLESYPYVWFPVLSADGTEVLADTSAGVTVEFQKEHGVGSHLARFELETGRGALVAPVFANDEHTLERDIVASCWTARSDASWSLSLHPDLAAQLKEPVTSTEDASWLARGRWADEAEIVLVSVLNKAIELVRQGASAAYLMPEIVAALVPIANSPVWNRQSEWLTNLRDITLSMVSSGELDGEAATAWLGFAIAIRAIEQGESDQISAIRFRR